MRAGDRSTAWAIVNLTGKRVKVSSAEKGAIIVVKFVIPPTAEEGDLFCRLKHEGGEVKVCQDDDIEIL